MGARGLTMGEKLYHGFYFSPWPFIWNKFHSNRTINVEVRYLGETLSPMGKRGLTMGEKLYFISHHSLPYEKTQGRHSPAKSRRLLVWLVFFLLQMGKKKWTNERKKCNQMCEKDEEQSFIWNKFHSNRSIIVEVHCLGETFPPIGGEGLTMGEKLYHGFHFSPWPSIWNKFHSNRTIIVEDRYLGETFSPMGARGLKLASPTILRGHN